MAVSHSAGGVSGWGPGPPPQHIKSAERDIRSFARAPTHKYFREVLQGFKTAVLIIHKTQSFVATHLASAPGVRDSLALMHLSQSIFAFLSGFSTKKIQLPPCMLRWTRVLSDPGPLKACASFRLVLRLAVSDSVALMRLSQSPFPFNPVSET